MSIAQGLFGSCKGRIQFISGFTGTVLSGGVTTVTLSGHQTGDLLIVRGGSQQTADPSFTSGWTKICSYYDATYSRVGLIVYKFATSADPDSISFTGSGNSTFNYSSGYIFRNVRAIGNFGVVTATGSQTSSVPSPALTLSDSTNAQSALILSSYVSNMGAAPSGLTVANGMAYGLLYSAWAGGNFTLTAGVNTPNCGIVELLY